MQTMPHRLGRILAAALLFAASTFEPRFVQPAAAADCSAMYCAWLEIVPGNGAGTGFVTTNPYGIECEWSGSRSGTCLFQFSWSHADTDGIDVDLYLDPGVHSYVCYGATCAGLEERLVRTVHLNPGNDIDVFPVFNAASHMRVNIAMGGTGNGRVTNAGAGLDCVGTAGQESGDCQGDWYWVPTGSIFRVSWTSDPGDDTYVCHNSTSCSSPNQTVNYSAGFGTGTTTFPVDFWKAVPLEVNLTGSGTVVSDPAGINCPSTCSTWFPPRTGAPEDDVVLTASPATGWFLQDWGGACDGVTGATCTFQVSYTGPTISVVFARLATPVPPPTLKPIVTPKPTAQPTPRPAATAGSGPDATAQATSPSRAPSLAPGSSGEGQPSADPAASPVAAAGSASPPAAGGSANPSSSNSAGMAPEPSQVATADTSPDPGGGLNPVFALLLFLIAAFVLAIGFLLGRRRRRQEAA